VIDWSGYYIKRVGEAMEGKWKSETTWWGVKEKHDRPESIQREFIR
jgi:basic membrane lipoprotein Med (substrate-binding protein (PBP1-ABC) superfamily)